MKSTLIVIFAKIVEAYMTKLNQSHIQTVVATSIGISLIASRRYERAAVLIICYADRP